MTDETRDLSEAARDRDGERLLVRSTEDGIGVYNPTRRSIFVILFLMVWLAGWSVGEFFALGQLLDGGPLAVDLFLMVWAAFWTFGGIVAWGVLLWQLFGVEKLFLLDVGAVVTERGLWWLTRRRVFSSATMSDPTLVDLSGHGAPGLTSPGRIAFTADGEKASFGIGLDDAEAARVMALLRTHLERHRPKDAEPADIEPVAD